MKSGIYKIENRRNGKCYIGSSVDIKQRWRAHRSALNSGKHNSPHLQNAWKKHGEDAFAFSIMLTCSPDRLLLHEQGALDAMTPAYNTCKTAGNCLGLVQSEEHRKRISDALKGRPVSQETRDKIGNAHKGRKPSSATIEKMRVAKLGTKFHFGFRHSTYSRYLIGKASRGRIVTEVERERLRHINIGRVDTIERLLKRSITRRLRMLFK